MDIHCGHPRTDGKGAECGKLLVLYRNGLPYVRCQKCGQETAIPLEGESVGNLDRLSVTA